MDKKDLKILDLGWDLTSPGEGSLEKSSLTETPSLFNFDCIFYDPISARNLWRKYLNPGPEGDFVLDAGSFGGLGKALSNLMETRRREAEGFFDQGGRLFFRFRDPGPGVRILKEEGQERIDTYSWIPTEGNSSLLEKLAPVQRKGSSLEVMVENHPIGEYLRNCEKDLLYEQACPAEVVEGLSSSDFKVIGKARSGDVVSFQMANFEGSVIAIPPTIRVDKDRESNGFLGAATNIVWEEPDWSEDFTLSRFRAAKSEFEELKEKKRELESKIEKKKEELKEEKIYRGVLYLSDRRSLSRSVREVLDALGYQVEESEDDYLDWKIDHESKCLAVVVEGEEGGPVDLDSYRRLILGKDELDAQTGKETKGIIIANGYSWRRPGDRDRQFTSRLQRRCESRGVELLTTSELFELLQSKVSDSGEKALESLRQRLLD